MMSASLDTLTLARREEVKSVGPPSSQEN